MGMKGDKDYLGVPAGSKGGQRSEGDMKGSGGDEGRKEKRGSSQSKLTSYKYMNRGPSRTSGSVGVVGGTYCRYMTVGGRREQEG